MSARILIATGLAAALAGATGYWLGRGSDHPHLATGGNDEREVLYWYDPMYPQQRFEQPGKSPFMDMDLIPRYADSDAGSAPGTAMQIDPRLTQNLGMRLAPVVRGPLQGELDAVGSLGFDQRDVALVQTRSAAFVERVYPLAPEDLSRARVAWQPPKLAVMRVLRLITPTLHVIEAEDTAATSLEDVALARVVARAAGAL